VELLVELATLQTCFITLDEAIKITNRRVNAIEHVIIPKIENTLTYIGKLTTHPQIISTFHHSD
jgi:V-type H+-transporting ATPase subunit D